MLARVLRLARQDWLEFDASWGDDDYEELQQRALQQPLSPDWPTPAHRPTPAHTLATLRPLLSAPRRRRPQARAPVSRLFFLFTQLDLAVQPRAQWMLVVVSETWAPGWRAFVDGVERPVELLDGTLLGVAVPPGGRAITLRYQEPLIATGLAFSAATALLLGLFWLHPARTQSHVR